MKNLRKKITFLSIALGSLLGAGIAQAVTLDSITVVALFTPEPDRDMEIKVTVVETSIGARREYEQVIPQGGSATIPVGLFGGPFKIIVTEMDPRASNVLGVIDLDANAASGSRELRYFTERVNVSWSTY